MITDVHTHIPSHQNKVPESEERYDESMQSGSQYKTKLTNSIDDYLKAMEKVKISFIFGIAKKPWDSESEILSAPGWDKKFNHNDIASIVSKLSPKKIVPFMSLHPMDKNLDYEYQRCLNELGIKGIKLGPNYQDFHPHSIEAMKLYARLENDNIPIIFHQGTSPVKNAPLEYSHPRYIDKIATVFPNLKMILAHLGHPWQEYCMSVVRKHKNVYADLSAQFYRPWSFWQGMNLFNEWGVLDKVFFGSDWPVTTPEQTLNGINNLNKYADKYRLPNFSEEILKKIIDRNVIDLLEINI